VAGIRGPDEGLPGNRPQTELLHHASNAFLTDSLTTTLQFLGKASASVAGQFLVDAFDLLPQLLVVGFTLAPAPLVGFVVIAAGGKPCYLAGFRN
jgi:hypothetical protein